MRRFGLFAGLTVFLFVIYAPAADKPPGCAVMTFEANDGVTRGEAKILADGLESELIQLKRYRMVSRANLTKVLEAQKVSMECAGTECAIEAGKIAAIEFVVFGSIGKVGETYSLVANLANVETGVIEKTAKITQSGKIDQLLISGVGVAAKKLVGVVGEQAAVIAPREEIADEKEEAVAVFSNFRQHKIVFSRGTYPNAYPWMCDLDGANAQQLADVKLASLPKIAGNMVVFMSENYGEAGSGIFMMKAVPDARVSKIPNTDKIRTRNGLNWDALDISPDGKRVVWAAPEDGDYYQNHNVFVINTDGTGKRRVQRGPNRHYCTITWGEPNRICLQVMNVGDVYNQRPHAMTPDGSELLRVVSEFAQNVHVGGQKGRVVMTWTQPRPYLVTMAGDFSDRVVLPGPLYGYTLTSWDPAEDAIYGSRDGNLYRIDVRSGRETLLVLGGNKPCSGGDVGEAE